MPYELARSDGDVWFAMPSGTPKPKAVTKHPKVKTAAASKARPSKTAVPAGKMPVRIFVSYSHLDTVAMEKLRTHLAGLMRDDVTVWFDGDMNAGDHLDTGIARALREAHIFVALLSPDYLASHYCWNIEYRRAMNRRARGTMKVVAAVVRPCDWKSTRAAGFKLLPRDGRPVTKWRSADEAFLDIAEGLKSVVRTVRKAAANQANPEHKTGRSEPAAGKTRMKPKTASPRKRPATPGPRSK